MWCIFGAFFLRRERDSLAKIIFAYRSRFAEIRAPVRGLRRPCPFHKKKRSSIFGTPFLGNYILVDTMYYSPCRGRRWSAECCWFKVVEVVDFYILLRREGFVSEIYFRVSFEVCRDKSPRPWVEKALSFSQKERSSKMELLFFL